MSDKTKLIAIRKKVTAEAILTNKAIEKELLQIADMIVYQEDDQVKIEGLRESILRNKEHQRFLMSLTNDILAITKEKFTNKGAVWVER